MNENVLHNEYRRVKNKFPTIDTDQMAKFMKEMPEESFVSILEYENEKEGYKCHIGTKALYTMAVNLLEWTGEDESGAKWSVDDIVRLSGVEFSTKSYTKYDFCYTVNKIYSDDGKNIKKYIPEDSKVAALIFDNAKSWLEDEDYMGDPSERAYKDAIKRIKFNFEY